MVSEYTPRVPDYKNGINAGLQMIGTASVIRDRKADALPAINAYVIKMALPTLLQRHQAVTISTLDAATQPISPSAPTKKAEIAAAAPVEVAATRTDNRPNPTSKLGGPTVH